MRLILSLALMLLSFNAPALAANPIYGKSIYLDYSYTLKFCQGKNDCTDSLTYSHEKYKFYLSQDGRHIFQYDKNSGGDFLVNGTTFQQGNTRVTSSAAGNALEIRLKGKTVTNTLRITVNGSKCKSSYKVDAVGRDTVMKYTTHTCRVSEGNIFK